MREGVNNRRVAVTGAGGFIGHNLVRFLKTKGFWVRGIDLKKPAFESSSADEFLIADLRVLANCQRAVRGVADVYHLAADMGGIGYITENHAGLARNNILMDANMLEAARHEGADRYLYTSSACVYPSFLQDKEEVAALKEEYAIPADPEKGYGWEKLFAEQMTRYFHEDYGLDVRIVRLHNIYGPLGTFDGGREKAPAAICRKVAGADEGSAIEIWGDGKQTRSFCYILDCIEGLLRIMDSGYTEPLNLGSEERITIDELIDIVCSVARKHLQKTYAPGRPQGVRGRNSDNSLVRKVLGWEPRTSIRHGVKRLYPWIWEQLDARGSARPPAPHKSPRET